MTLLAMRCEGYKAFAKATEISLRPITVFFGKNNSGKTTLARLPIFISSSFANRPELYSLGARGVRFGGSFRDLASADQPHPRITFGMTWSPGQGLMASLQYLAVRGGKESVQPAILQIDNDSPTAFSLRESEQEPSLTRVNSQLAGSTQERFSQRRDYLRALLQSTLHIASSRPSLQKIYELRDATDWSTSEVPYLLAQNRHLLSFVNDWYRRQVDDGGLDVDYAGFAFRLVTRPSGLTGAPVDLAETGRGTQSILPVATLLTGIVQEMCRPRLVIIEEPEAHLHPSAHGAAADLLIRSSEYSQVIVETHSEHLILRLRRRIAEGRLSAARLALYYVDENHDTRLIHIDDHGTTSDWPTGVFEYDVEEAQAIVNARLEAIKRAEES